MEDDSETKDQLLTLYRRIAELEKTAGECERAKEELLSANVKFKAILHASPLAIQTLTPDGIVTLWNDAAERVFGWRREEVIGKFNPMVPEDKLEEFHQLKLRVLSGESFSGVDVSRRKKDGSRIEISLSTAPLYDSRGNVSGIMAIITDITQRKRLEEEMRLLSVTDELTGLYNRRGFFVLAHQFQKVSKRQKRDLFMLYADLDGLKTINDTYGHKEGDKALKDIALILKETCRESDIIARMGGDEFAVILVGTKSEDVGKITDRLRANLDGYNEKKTDGQKLSISWGIAHGDSANGLPLDSLLSAADAEMYEQKQLKKARQTRNNIGAIS